MTHYNNKKKENSQNKINFCGSLESGDCLVTIEENKEDKINIHISSPFIRQFGKKIKKISLDILVKNNINSCNLIIQDQGAIDEVIKSRIITVLNKMEKIHKK
ncbi:MAG: citrate lyase subunit gamma (acyl carrier protein) [Candidatus Phytoplasma cynodontis]|uniref:citrate lyase acyl carrier protein n=1 Tax='Cynodon dactylon' phytoplasma TaxID=295320 RepID=UPI00186AF990|nr:citrate lyase acyl carrier protein ['Cynodon dactylon' phytoplasma]WIA07557.1 MAG: citrate lyase subunit gamma (acyl carrier protein) [Candidatus Phytoplasma cynodontis]